VITGEGSLDEQSLLGKTPVGVARAAAAAGVPVVAVCGRTTLTTEQQQDSGFRQVYPLTDLEPRIDICIAQAGSLLEELGKNILQALANPAPADGTGTKEPLNV